MSKSIPLFGLLLLVGLAASWSHYTSDEAPRKDGIVLLDEKKADIAKIEYTSPDLVVSYETREDSLGTYGWVTVTETKKKPAKKDEPPPPPETKVTKFKAGAAADKLLDAFGPMVAMRELSGLDDEKIKTFGLDKPDTIVKVTAGSRNAGFEVGGETYGTRDRYVRDQASNRIYVVDDEVFKPLKFANTRLPERALEGPKVEEIDSITLGAGSQTVEWTQKNKDDRAAAYWERGGQTGKDETFKNWLDKALKLKSTAYVQEGDAPAELVPVFDLTVRVQGSPAQTVRVSKSGDDWYAQSEFTRGLVKLSRGPASDAAGEVDDILEGREPPKKEPPKPPPGGPPGAAGGPPGRPPMPPRPGMMPPPPAPKP